MFFCSAAIRIWISASRTSLARCSLRTLASISVLVMSFRVTFCWMLYAASEIAWVVWRSRS